MVDTWWSEINAFITTGITNAKTEGYNRLVKQVKRSACGFRNVDNSARRIRFDRRSIITGALWTRTSQMFAGKRDWRRCRLRSPRETFRSPASQRASATESGTLSYPGSFANVSLTCLRTSLSGSSA
ncbi:transposase [Rhodococcus sp. EPR-157]|uniref:transposase n=1 Tax=Rhodococcus sp. EPR-157 TaxID=1813677 RepID=UPI0009EE871C|nr:transposase [Rhodococcus sp. EPR-157]